jgi:hypothetical protein
MFNIEESLERCGDVINNANLELAMLNKRIAGGNESSIANAESDTEYNIVIIQRACTLSNYLNWLIENEEHDQYLAIKLIVEQMYDHEYGRLLAINGLRSGGGSKRLLNVKAINHAQAFTALEQAVYILKGIC